MRTSSLTSRNSSTRAGRWTRPVAAAALAACLVGASSSAANAQIVEHPDAAGDMTAQSGETGEIHPAPDHVRNDALVTTLTHSARRVSVRVQYAELQRVGHLHGLYVGMVTNEGVRREVHAVAEPNNWAGDAEMWRGGERSVRCAIRVSLNYADNVTTVSFPRRCLSSPRWIKFRAISWAYEGETVYVDDALSDEPYSGETAPTQSKRVYRASSS